MIRGVRFTLVTMCCSAAATTLVVWGIGADGVPAARREGSLIRGPTAPIVGSRLIAQKFTRPTSTSSRGRRAWTTTPRPPAAPTTGPSNPDHLKAVERARRRRRARAKALAAGQVPSEMVTASGAGTRPAPPAGRRRRCRSRASPRARGVDRRTRARSSRAHTEPPTLGFLGRARVNVLRAEPGARRGVRRAVAAVTTRPATSSGHDTS